LQEESPLAKITRDSAKITVEQVHGLMSQVIANTILLPKKEKICKNISRWLKYYGEFCWMQVIKDILFNSVHQANKSRTETSDPEPMIES
jgi:COP9 signalosome complex subunit 5